MPPGLISFDPMIWFDLSQLQTLRHLLWSRKQAEVLS